MFKKFGCIILIISFILSMGCAKKEDLLETFNNNVDHYYGKVEDGIFHNDYMKFSLNIPEDWNIVEDQVKQQMELMAEQLFEKDPSSLENIDLEQIRVYNMLFLFKYPVENQDKFNPSILTIVERLEEESVENEETYLQASQTLMASNELPMGFEYVFKEDFEQVEIAGEAFTVMEVALKTSISDVNQKFFARLIDDKVLSFMISYSDDTEEQELMEVLQTLKFD